MIHFTLEFLNFLQFNLMSNETQETNFLKKLIFEFPTVWKNIRKKKNFFFLFAKSKAINKSFFLLSFLKSYFKKPIHCSCVKQSIVWQCFVSSQNQNQNKLLCVELTGGRQNEENSTEKIQSISSLANLGDRVFFYFKKSVK